MSYKTVWLVLAAVALLALPASAQNPSGSISGHLVDATGLALPGVTVTLASPNLQGLRTTTSSGIGDYVVPSLPPGPYTVTFELSGFDARALSVDVAATQTVTLNASLAIASMTTRVDVVGKAPSPSAAAPQNATTFKQDLIASLPNNHTLDAALLMAPSVHPSGPRRTYSTAGSTSFENLFMINGVVVNENLGGQALPLYIEDAVQETTITTSGVSAEYGRFGGGVINVITKSGGNHFSGSFRDTLYNDNWRTLTPFAADSKIDKMVPAYAYTFGGPILKDRLWFFNAGRFLNQRQSLQTRTTNLPYVRGDDTKRYEGKLTFTPRANHTIKGSFSKINQRITNDTQFNVMDFNSLYNDTVPQDLLSVSYGGVVRPNLFVEAQYSLRHFSFVNTGAPTTDLIKGTLLVDNQRGTRYFSPTFCGVCDSEKRDNDDLFVKGSYSLSSRKTGSHDMVFGYDTFDDKRFVNNHQSGSDYRIVGTTSIVQGSAIYPVFLGNDTTTIQYNPIVSGSEGTHLRTHSLFYNDRWRPTPRLALNLGFRWDKNHGRNGAGQLVSTSGAFSPRLGASWDPKGDGVLAFNASFGKYAASLANSVADSSSTGGQAATYRWLYQGPSINPSATGTLVGPDAAIQQVFDWFNANGGLNRPPLSASVPGVSTQIAGSLESPYALEYAGGMNRQLGRRGAVHVETTYRTYKNFYATVTDTATGRVTDPFGKSFDLGQVENTDAVQRKYAGLATTLTYRLASGLNAGAAYTLSHAWGNFEGEAANGSGPSTTSVLGYPEYKDPAWNNPTGDLAVDQRHRLSAWATYSVPFVRGLSISGLQSVASGVPFAAVGSVNAAAFVTNPGYVTPQGGSGVTYYFSERDAYRTAAGYRTDMAASYAFTVKGIGRKTDLFVQAQVLNVFDKFQLCGCGDTVFRNGGGVDLTTIDQSVLTRLNSATLATFNPFTTTPVEGANFALGPNFGKALSRMAYTVPRTFRMTFGVRF